MPYKTTCSISSGRVSLLSTDFNKVSNSWKVFKGGNLTIISTFKLMCFDLIICINFIPLMLHIHVSGWTDTWNNLKVLSYKVCLLFCSEISYNSLSLGIFEMKPKYHPGIQATEPSSVTNHTREHSSTPHTGSRSDTGRHIWRYILKRIQTVSSYCILVQLTELFDPRQSNNWQVSKKRAKSDSLPCSLLVPYWEQALCSHKLPGFFVIPRTQTNVCHLS